MSANIPVDLKDGGLYRILNVDVNACIEQLDPKVGDLPLAIRLSADQASQYWVLKKNAKGGWNIQNQGLNTYISFYYDKDGKGLFKVTANITDATVFTTVKTAARTRDWKGPQEYAISFNDGRFTKYLAPQNVADMGEESTFNDDPASDNFLTCGSPKDDPAKHEVEQQWRWWFQPITPRPGPEKFDIYRIVNKLTNTSLTLKEDSAKVRTVVGSHAEDGDQSQYWQVKKVDGRYTIKNVKVQSFLATTDGPNLTLVDKVSTNQATYWEITKDGDYYKVTNAAPLTTTVSPIKIVPENKLFLDLKGGNPSDGTTVEGWVDNNGVGNQRWSFLSVPSTSVRVDQISVTVDQIKN